MKQRENHNVALTYINSGHFVQLKIDLHILYYKQDNACITGTIEILTAHNAEY